MARKALEWQKAADNVVNNLKSRAARAARMVSPDAAATIIRVLGIKSISISDSLGDAGFRLSEDGTIMELSLNGLNLIASAGAGKKYWGWDKEEFLEFAVSLYLFHEVHHIVQKLIRFDDVQLLKRTAGKHKLSEFDLIADIIAAQIVAAIYSDERQGGRRDFAEGFLVALSFMIAFCFPAFGFPLERRHKVQRAFGIVLSAVLTERAIITNHLDTPFEVPLYPSFSRGFRELAVVAHGGGTTVMLATTVGRLRSTSVRELLAHIDSGDLEGILEKARALV